MKLFNKVAIIGVGLIGGSLGLAIKKKKLASRIIGIGHHRKSIAQALRLKAIDEGSLSLSQIKDADLVILAAAVETIIDFLPKVSKLIKKDCIVIDVGSTKKQIMSCANRFNIDFIGCHPLAGLEKKGVISAKSNLFENSLCPVVPLRKTKKDSLRRIIKFWEELGARTKLLEAAEHDRILSLVSHLPHAVAFSLVSCIDRDDVLFAAGGLKDTTRIALSDPCLWRDIFLTNKEQVLKAIDKFKDSLSTLESLIKNNQPNVLESYLRKSRNRRNEF